jgi:hypothetical protein
MFIVTWSWPLTSYEHEQVKEKLVYVCDPFLSQGTMFWFCIYFAKNGHFNSKYKCSNIRRKTPMYSTKSKHRLKVIQLTSGRPLYKTTYSNIWTTYLRTIIYSSNHLSKHSDKLLQNVLCHSRFQNLMRRIF